MGCRIGFHTSAARYVASRWTDLSFLLRTVIVDSLELRMDMDGENTDQTSRSRRRIMEEAEFRLGFAIRDLPADTGHEKWLNPLTARFSVQCAAQAAFRMMRKDTLFPTLTPSNKLLLHCRFIMQPSSPRLRVRVRHRHWRELRPLPRDAHPRHRPNHSGVRRHLCPVTRAFGTAGRYTQRAAFAVRAAQCGRFAAPCAGVRARVCCFGGAAEKGGLKEYEAAPLLATCMRGFWRRWLFWYVRTTRLVFAITLCLIRSRFEGLERQGTTAGSTVDVLALKQPLRGIQCLHDLLSEGEVTLPVPPDSGNTKAPASCARLVLGLKTPTPETVAVWEMTSRPLGELAGEEAPSAADTIVTSTVLAVGYTKWWRKHRHQVGALPPEAR
ncbi:Spc98 family-domain-containing protein [Salix suchowensis]|nr:Spc98 family-domain-containing protein [Salix suchowensis]